MTSVTWLSSKIDGLGLVKRAGALQSAAGQGSATPRKLVSRSWVSLLALVCTGCPVGAALDAPYEDYVPPVGGNITSGNGSGTVTGTGGASSTGTATTGGTMCGDAEVDAIFLMKCSNVICHGDPGGNPTVSSGLFLFSPTRNADMLDRPGIVSDKYDCSAERVIDSANPAASLMITTLTRTAPCNVQMPVGPKLPQTDIDCITQWVNSVASGGL